MFLDEPSAGIFLACRVDVASTDCFVVLTILSSNLGIDPYNRRQVWDMIIAAKAGRSIILTTHFLVSFLYYLVSFLFIVAYH